MFLCVTPIHDYAIIHVEDPIQVLHQLFTDGLLKYFMQSLDLQSV